MIGRRDIQKVCLEVHVEEIVEMLGYKLTSYDNMNNQCMLTVECYVVM